MARSCTTATLVFGKDVNTLESGEDAIQRHIGVIFPMLSYRVNALLPYWRYFKLPKDYQLDRSLKVVRAFAEEMIGHARERMRNAPGEPPRNLLEHFSIRFGVPRVCEISFAFFFGNTFEKRGDCSPKFLNSARLHFA
jgi:hypothetical protein